MSGKNISLNHGFFSFYNSCIGKFICLYPILLLLPFTLIATADGKNKTQRAGILPKLSLMAFLTLAGIGVTQEADAQTRDITKDTTEIRTFFKNPKIFSAEEMKEFDILRNNNLKSPIGEFVLDYILMNFDIKSSDYEATVFTCILLDPDRKTNLGKRAYEEIKKNRMLKVAYDLMVEGIQTKIELKQTQEKRKEEEEKLKEEEEKGKQLDKKIAEKEATLKEKEAELKEKEATLKEKKATLKEKEATLKEKEAELKESQNLLKSLQEMRKAFEEFGKK